MGMNGFEQYGEALKKAQENAERIARDMMNRKTVAFEPGVDTAVDTPVVAGGGAAAAAAAAAVAGGGGARGHDDGAGGIGGADGGAVGGGGADDEERDDFPRLGRDPEEEAAFVDADRR